MREAVRVGDLTAHGSPLQGAGSPDVFIGGQQAWRAMPEGAGDGLDEASKDTKAIMDVLPTPAQAFAPSTVAPKAAKIEATMTKVAAQVEEALGMCGPSNGVRTAFGALKATTITLTAAYGAAAAVPGGEPGARVAFTTAYQMALSAAMGAAVTALAGPWDMHACPQSSPAPHGPGLVIKASKTVEIDGLPAVFVGNEVQEAAGGPNAIQIGCGTVIIGDTPPATSSAGGQGRKISKNGSAGPGSASSNAGGASNAGPDSAKDEGPAVRPEKVTLWVRLDIPPEDAHDDRFVLTSTDGGYSSSKTVKDDQLPNDESIDLKFENVDTSLSYTLEVITETGSHKAFEDVPYASLVPATIEPDGTDEA